MDVKPTLIHEEWKIGIMWPPIINLPIGDGLKHPFVVMTWG